MKNYTQHGIPLRQFNYCMAGITLLLSIFLLYAAQQISNSYTVMQHATDDYISLQESAHNMQLGSDYLTEQARCFVITGEIEHLDNYFYELNSNHRRDQALLNFKKSMADTEACANLESAMQKSQDLTKIEFYAMRLTHSAFGYNLWESPIELQSVKLTRSDEALNQTRQSALARGLMFGNIYRDMKRAISKDIQTCLDELVEETELIQSNASSQLQRLLKIQQLLIILLVISISVIVLSTSFTVIAPLRNAISNIRAEQPLPIEGAYEFRFLAKTYNLMYETNRVSKEKLAYEATHDGLTDVYNRSGYDLIVQNVDLSTSALLLIDVDRFKGVNDTYGHDTGDRVIRFVASTLKGNFRTQDYVCRIGGDEFAIIMLHTDSDDTEIIRKKISIINQTLQISKPDLPPASISVGISFGNNRHTIDTLFKDADTALYKAKEIGRHDCVFYSEI